MKLSDIAMRRNVPNEVKDMFDNLRALLNNGRYQTTIYTVAPTASDLGEEGETRYVLASGIMYQYIYDGSNWHYSTALTKVT